MPRNSSGVYTLPTSVNPVVSGTKITTQWWNTTGADIAAALTQSVSSGGTTSPTAPIKFFDGTVSLPGITWVSEVSSGWYRAGAGDHRYSILGVDAFKVLAAGGYTPDIAGGTFYRVGFRCIPPVDVAVNTTITPTSIGKGIRHSAVGTVTVNLQANATAAWEDGAAVTFINKNGAGVMTITATDPMRREGTGATGSRQLAANGMATAIWDASSGDWLITGTATLT